jgi:tRNA(Ile)-lysidine synthase
MDSISSTLGLADAPVLPEVISAAEFAALMVPLGPFGAAPRLAAGISGGPDSLALAVLAAEWARARGGSLLALVVDHGLRPESAAEAWATRAQLLAQGIVAHVLSLVVAPGPGLQARAREARLTVLAGAAAAAGRPWVLLGHQRGDQAETLLVRAASGSGAAGLAGIPPVRALHGALLLRPLLSVPKLRLEATCAAAGLLPVRDPSNNDARFARARWRASLADSGPKAEAELAELAAGLAVRRAGQQAAIAARLAASTRWHPEGFADIDPVSLGSDVVADAALAALLRVVSGARYAPARAATAALRQRGHGTLSGAWLQAAPAARSGTNRPGWRLLREPAAPAAAVPALRGARWDGRFRLVGPGHPAASIGQLGRDATDSALRRAAPHLPGAVLAGLPAIRHSGGLVAVPALLYPNAMACAPFAMVFSPVAGPATG